MNPTFKSILSYIGIAEGISYLILVGIGMPLKYFFDMPIVVKHVGMAHGWLFIAFSMGVAWPLLKSHRSIKWAALGWLCSLLPFGTFWFDKEIKNL